MTTLTVEPIRADIGFGARVGGVTRDACADDATRAEINDLFERYGLLVFEDVEPNPQMQVAISTVVGPLKDHPSQATPRAGGELGVIEIRHLPNEGGRVRLRGEELSQWLPWHFDHCYNDELNRAGVLRAVEIPPDGGRTGFVDGIALYQAIAPELRDRIEGETVLYAMDVIMDNLRFGRPADLVEVEASPEAAAVMDEFADRPRALHPAVWTRRTGEKVLHVSPWMAKGLAGHEDADGDALLAAVCEEIFAVATDLELLPPVAADRHGDLGQLARAARGVGDEAVRRSVHAPHHDQGRLRPRPLRGSVGDRVVGWAVGVVGGSRVDVDVDADVDVARSVRVLLGGQVEVERHGVVEEAELLTARDLRREVVPRRLGAEGARVVPRLPQRAQVVFVRAPPASGHPDPPPGGNVRRGRAYGPGTGRGRNRRIRRWPRRRGAAPASKLRRSSVRASRSARSTRNVWTRAPSVRA